MFVNPANVSSAWTNGKINTLTRQNKLIAWKKVNGSVNTKITLIAGTKIYTTWIPTTFWSSSLKVLFYKFLSNSRNTLWDWYSTILYIGKYKYTKVLPKKGPEASSERSRATPRYQDDGRAVACWQPSQWWPNLQLLLLSTNIESKMWNWNHLMPVKSGDILLVSMYRLPS